MTSRRSPVFPFLSILCCTVVSTGILAAQNESPAPPSPADSADATEPKHRAYRLSTRKKPAPEKKEKGKDWGEDDLEEGAVSVGLATGQSQLPPELKDLAQQGTVAALSKDWKKSRELFLEMVQKAPDNALAYANLGVAEHQLENRLAATANLKKSLQLNPSISRNWQTLGLIQYESGDLNLAISSLTRAIHEDPKDGHNRLFLAAVLRDYGWEEAAVTELKRALQLDDTLADAHYNLALTYLGEDPPRIELARRHYFAAIDLGTEPSPELEKQLSSPE